MANQLLLAFEGATECAHTGGIYGDHEYGTTFCSNCHAHVCRRCLQGMPAEMRWNHSTARRERFSKDPYATRCAPCQAKVDEDSSLNGTPP